MTAPITPKAAHPRRGQAGRASPPSNRARPAIPSNDRSALLIGGLFAGWLILNAFMAITDPAWWAQ